MKVVSGVGSKYIFVIKGDVFDISCAVSFVAFAKKTSKLVKPSSCAIQCILDTFGISHTYRSVL